MIHAVSCWSLMEQTGLTGWIIAPTRTSRLQSWFSEVLLRCCVEKAYFLVSLRSKILCQVDFKPLQDHVVQNDLSRHRAGSMSRSIIWQSAVPTVVRTLSLVFR